jgi:hypothetical protein
MTEIQLLRSAYASIAWQIAGSLGLVAGGGRPGESLAIDADLLEALRGAFVVEPPNTTSDLLPLLYHIPAAVNPSSDTEIDETRELIRAAVETGAIDARLESIPLICKPWPRFQWTSTRLS